jgi:hypothetical protein
MVEYIDELGRTRKGTKAEAAREEMRKKTNTENTDDRFTARPIMPQQIIYGDTIQTSAFNPEESVAEQMAAVAAKRDRGDTPPPDTHFDSKAEIRTRGTGFYAFSAQEEERKQQMKDLEKQRRETEKRRSEADKRKEERRKEIEERRKAIQERRAKGKADRFLDSLGVEWAEKKESEAENVSNGENAE